MIARIWSTGIIKGKEEEYLSFAKNESLRMFKMQTGIVDVQILVQQEKSLVITYWSRVEDIERMDE